MYRQPSLNGHLYKAQYSRDGVGLRESWQCMHIVCTWSWFFLPQLHVTANLRHCAINMQMF